MRPCPEYLVLITTHNRSNQLLSLLQSLQSICSSDLRLKVAVGNSGEESVPSVKSEFFSVSELGLEPTTFWAAGMEKILAQEPNWPHGVIWMNEDITPDIERLKIALIRLAESNSIHFGTFQDRSGAITYGGWERRGRFKLVRQSEFERGTEADYCNGNLVVIPRRVSHTIPRFPSGFGHGYADFALGSLARQSKVRLVSMGLIGTCERQAGFLSDSLNTPKEYWERLTHPKGLQFSSILRWREIESGIVLGWLETILISLGSLLRMVLRSVPF